MPTGMTAQTTALAQAIKGGRFHVRHDGKRVHLTDDPTSSKALCGAVVKPWSRPDPRSDVHAGCAAKTS